mgnify:CR=1 FL=1|jgi:hypothetical protein
MQSSGCNCLKIERVYVCSTSDSVLYRTLDPSPTISIQMLCQAVRPASVSKITEEKKTTDEESR